MSSQASPKESLVASIMQFLTDELADTSLNDDAKESIEVAIQCLETAYNINPVDGSLPAKKPLLEIFSSFLADYKETETKPTISEDAKKEADALKNEGNEMMKNLDFNNAINAYTKAIEIDSTNPIYYCNRAAAHSKLDNHQAALEDCKISIKFGPKYSKAYTRMGLAYVNLNDHQRARDSYKKAVELDPSENNKSNLNLAEQKLKEEQLKYGGGMNFANVLNNPNLMNFATQMMSDPNMQNMLSNIMNVANQNDGAGGGGGLDAFLNAGQQFAQQMQSANPELVEQLKSAFKKPDGDPKDTSDGEGQN